MRTLTHYRLIAVVATLLVAGGCTVGDQPDPYVGNMDDFSYAGRRGKSYGPSASGKTIQIADFKGRFVWIDYSAPWCGPCLRQARVIKQIEKAHGNKVVFITMMTSDHGPGRPATRQTARQWSKQFALEPDHVVPTDERHRTIPQHVVFSPLGQTLYWKVGLHNGAQIRSVLAEHMREWQSWYKENENSLSIMMSEIDG
jgi:thiol-disulfide isomerase/thioredoxin